MTTPNPIFTTKAEKKTPSPWFNIPGPTHYWPLKKDETIIGEKNIVEKEYLVRVEGFLSEENLNLLRYGLSLDGYQLKPAIVNWLNKNQLSFILTEGRNRQIRRMCELVGLKVTGLKRVRIGPIILGDLKEGQWKFLTKPSFF
jgi:23S rRNA pseudouridine2604 synthase